VSEHRADVAENVTPAIENKQAKARVNRRKKPRGVTHKAGYFAAKRALQKFSTHAIDGRTRAARALDGFRNDILRDLGGPEAVSQQERVIVDLAVRTHFMVQSLDSYLLGLGSLVNKRKRSVWPVVRERVMLADSLARYMGQLGLQRREKPVPDIRTYLSGAPTMPHAEEEMGRPEAIGEQDEETTVEKEPA
jgi:hypothetical protein